MVGLDVQLTERMRSVALSMIWCPSHAPVYLSKYWPQPEPECDAHPLCRYKVTADARFVRLRTLHAVSRNNLLDCRAEARAALLELQAERTRGQALRQDLEEREGLHKFQSMEAAHKLR